MYPSYYHIERSRDLVKHCSNVLGDQCMRLEEDIFRFLENKQLEAIPSRSYVKVNEATWRSIIIKDVRVTVSRYGFNHSIEVDWPRLDSEGILNNEWSHLPLRMYDIRETGQEFCLETFFNSQNHFNEDLGYLITKEEYKNKTSGSGVFSNGTSHSYLSKESRFKHGRLGDIPLNVTHFLWID